jgi:hypothetical protein
VSLGRYSTIGLITAACIIGAYASAFRLWRTEWLHHLGLILVGAGMPWVAIAGALNLLTGYWAQLIAAWLGLAINVTLAAVLLSWVRQRW